MNFVEEWTIKELGSDINRAMDMKDWAKLLDHCSEKIVLSLSDISGKSVIEINKEAFVAQVAAIHPPHKRSFHSHSNVSVTSDGDDAKLTAHSYGWNFSPGSDGPVHEVWGMTTYGFARQKGAWLLTHFGLDKWREVVGVAVAAPLHGEGDETA